MKKIFLFLFFLLAGFAKTTLVNAQGQPASRIGLIDTYSFDNKNDGIKKYTQAMDALNTEFKPRKTKLDNLATQIQKIRKEAEDIQKMPEARQNELAPQLQSKIDENEKLTRIYKFEEEDANAAFERRKNDVLGPVQKQIGEALQEYAKKMGYTIILDAAKAVESGLLLAIGDETADITRAFITYYNKIYR